MTLKTNAMPPRPEIARHLAGLALLLPGRGSAEGRDRLCGIADLLCGVHPNVEAAAAEATRGLAHASLPESGEQEHETWLLLAFAELLRPAAPRPTAQPTAGDLAGWTNALDVPAVELLRSPALDAAVMVSDSEVWQSMPQQMRLPLAMKFQELRGWLSGLVKGEAPDTE